MTDLLTPDEVRKELDDAEAAVRLELGHAGLRAVFKWVARICRDYLTLWDELAHEREIADEAVKRVTQLEQEIGALMR